MEINTRSGKIRGVRYVPSPNCDARPVGMRAELIVVHSISLPPGEFGGSGVEQLFTNTLHFDANPYYEHLRGLQVSAHALIRRQGDLVQFVPFHRRAWHAGQSKYEGRENCNDFSIGIELEGTDDTDFPSCQLQALASLVVALGVAYPWLHAVPVVGHSDIAPGRKTDPGPHFDWQQLDHLLDQARTMMRACLLASADREQPN